MDLENIIAALDALNTDTQGFELTIRPHIFVLTMYDIRGGSNIRVLTKERLTKLSLPVSKVIAIYGAEMRTEMEGAFAQLERDAAGETVQ